MAITLSAEQRTEYLAEISSGKRVIVYNGEPYVLSFPAMQDIMDGRIIYIRFYSEYRRMTPPVPTRVEARQMLQQAIADAGMDSTVLERRQKVLQEAGLKMQEKIPQERLAESMQSPSGLLVLFNEYLSALTADERNLMMEVQEQTQMEEDIMSHCAEAMAEEMRDLYLLSRCVRDQNGKAVWGDYADVMMEKDSNRIMSFRGQLSLFWAGTPSVLEATFDQQIEVMSELKKDGASNS